MVQGLKAVLFDLDGTLADTAQDLGLALNLMRRRRGLDDLSQESIRPHVSNGVKGLLGLGFGISPEDAGYDEMREEYLANYMENLCNGTRLFEGMDALLSEIGRRGLPWGIVTNKPMKYAAPLVEKLGLAAAVVVGGDSCPRQKPHPDPLLHAAKILGISPESCLYLGDDRRDVEASLAANMKPVIAAYGYLGAGGMESWGAEGSINHPLELLRYLA